jgi:hypothetical protein
MLVAAIGLLALTVTSVAANEPASVRIVEPGASAAIVLPASLAGHPRPGVPEQSETLNAALHLSEYIGKMTGLEPPVVCETRGQYLRKNGAWKFDASAKPAGNPEIHVGWTARALKELDQAEVEKLDVDGFRIKTTPDAIFLVGSRDWSTAYAVYTFLEEFCGVRWFLPGDLGEDVPRAPALAVPVVDKKYEPAYLHRQYSGFQFRDDFLRYWWGMRQKVRARLEFHHNLYAIFDPAKYGASMPELFPVLNGQRRVPGPGNYGAWQPCLTHPKAVDITIEYAKEFFAKHPRLSSISLGINDGAGYCECANCRKLVDGSLPREQRRARWFFDYANAVAGRFEQEFPDKLIGYLLYGEASEIPPGLKVHPKLIGFYVHPSFSLITEEGKQKFDAALAELAKTSPRFGLYDWFYGYQVLMPRLQIRQAKYWLQHGYEMGARHIKAEAYMSWGLDGFKYWMHTKLMWDPTLDVDAMMEEFLTRFFQESAGPMREYFRVIEHYTVTPVTETAQGKDGEFQRLLNFRFRYLNQFESFPPEAVRKCDPLLEQAEKMAQSEIVRERIRYCRAAFEVTKMLSLRYDLLKRALPLLEKPESLAEGIPLLAEAMGRDLDVEQYWKLRFPGDPFCVRAPEPTMLENVTVARHAAAATLGERVIEELRKRTDPIIPASLDAAINGVLSQAWAKVADPDAASVAKVSIAPIVGKMLIANKADAPKLDGVLDDACWRIAVVYADFDAVSTGKRAQFRTEARAVHDGESIYLAFRCFQDTKVLLAWTKERDGRVWRDDSVEVLLNRPTDTKKEERCQVIVSTTGNIFDYHNGSTKWDGDIRTGIRIEPEHYTIEMAIPLKEIGIDPATDRFLKINLTRNVYGRKELGIGEPKEASAWYLSDDNPNPKSRGWLIFNP